MNILELLRDRRIDYIEDGPNVKHGYANIKCPFCGEADPSMHLGIELTTGRWACWRNTEHCGRSLPRLLQKLLGCSYEVAQGLITSHTDFSSVISRLKSKTETTLAKQERLPPEKGLVALEKVPPDKAILYKRFWDYLRRRGFDYTHTKNIARLYGLQCALSGRFKNRIVFPIVMDGGIVGYTGRCIDNGKLRYLSHPGTIVKQNILWYDELRKGGHTLFVCEGPIDALRMDYGCKINNLQDRATCVFGTAYTVAQIEKLYELRPYFDKLVILLDKDALGQTLRLSGILSSLSAHSQFLPSGVKDPGDLTWEQVKCIAEQNAPATFT